jgi:hypothetical protein
MATDWWPEQNGRITDGLTIMCNAEAAITEGSAVAFGTSTGSQIRVQNAAGLGDGWGVALRAATSAGDGVPVVVYGLYKMTQGNGGVNTTQGDFVMNSTTIYFTDVAGAGTFVNTNLKVLKGTSYILGMAMQTTTANSDKCVIFIGKGI